MTYKEALRAAQAILSSSAAAFHFVQWATRMPQAALIASPDKQLTPDAYDRFTEGISSLEAHKPLAYILETVPFLAVELTDSPT